MGKMSWRKCLILFFIIFIYLPMTGLIFNIQDGLENTEKRNMAKFPKYEGLLKTGEFLDGFLKYYEDNFGFRYSFIRLGTNLKIKLFKTYPKNIDIKVLVGKDGWLFYKLGNEIEDYEGRVPFKNNMVDKISRNLYKKEKMVSPAKFYVLIPPDKTVIYEEYLPDSILEKKNIENSRIKGLLKSGVKIIYPKDSLIKNKKTGQIYFKTDTHWTYLGGYFGYKELMENISKDFKDVKILGLDNFKKIRYTHNNPDLAEIVGVGKKNYEEDFIYKCNISQKADLKVVVFGDSFYKYLDPYLKCTFKDVRNIDSRVLDFNIIKELKPDIIILEIVQRNLRRLNDTDKF